jgi:hypothetical protein
MHQEERKLKARHILVIVLALYLMALAVRFIPMSTSSLPYNQDSLVEARMASDIVSSGSMDYPQGASYLSEKHSTITPMYNLFLAISAILMGSEPIKISPIMVPLITSVSVVAMFMIVMKITRNKYAATASGLFLALSGTYVTVTLAPWKEALGFAIIPILVYLYVNRQDDIRIRGLAIFLLLMLPFFHHLVTAVAYLIVTFITLIPLTQRFLQRKIGRNDWLDAGLLGFLWFIAYAYYYTSQFNRVEMFKADSGMWLFISVFIAMIVIGLYTARRTKTKLYLVAPIALLTIGLFVINYFVPIFPYTIGTNKSLFAYILPYTLLLYPLILGFAVLIDSSSPYRVMLISLFLAPFTIIGFAFMYGLNPTTSYPMVIRVYDFLAFGIAIGIGIGAAYMMKKLRSANFRTVLAVIFVALCLATTPIAYNSTHVFEIQTQTKDYEMSTIEWIKEKNLNGINISSDRRIWELANRVYDIKGDYTLPIAMKRSLPNNTICIIETQWSKSPGAQMWPLDSVIVPERDIKNTFLPYNNILYSTVAKDTTIYLMTSPYIPPLKSGK